MHRADHVDAHFWHWIRAFLSNPTALTKGLSLVQSQRQQESAPLRERLKVVDNLLTDNRARLERLLDLYLAGDFEKEVLIDRKSRTEATIDALEQERANLNAQLEAESLTNGQLQAIVTFAAELREELNIADIDFETRRGLIELLDAKVTLTAKDGKREALAECVLARQVLSIASRTTSGSRAAKIATDAKAFWRNYSSQVLR